MILLLIILWIIIACVHFYRTFGSSEEDLTFFDSLLMFPLIVILEVLVISEAIKHFFKKDNKEMQRCMANSSIIRFFRK